MKKSHIFILVVIAVAIGIVIGSLGETSEYVNFKKAEEMASKGVDNQIHVIGTLKKLPDGTFDMYYEPTEDPNYFQFTMIDENGMEETIILPQPKPADIDKSEKVVVIGGYKNGVFLANKVLLKCPSKYVEEEIKV